MDDGSTALRSRPYPRTRAAGERASARRVGPHHRRRRATAGLLLLALVALIAGMIDGAGSGGTTVNVSAVPRPGFFTAIAQLAGEGTGSFALAEARAENAAINRTLAYTPYVRIAGAEHREIALTFDDGPGPYTPSIISTLERYRVPATFFEVGVLEQYFHASTTAIAAHGWVIGDHTMDHAPMAHLSPRDQRSQLLQQTAATGQYGAPFPRLFRPPYGLWNPATLSLLARYRMLMILWTIDTSDYTLPGVDAIVHAAVSGARPGAIILMHDAGGNRAETVAALPLIIQDLRARGYQLVSVPKLLLDNPAPHNQQISAVIGTGG